MELLAPSRTTVDRWRTSKLMAKPNSSICMSGTPTIMPKVTRSRDSCRISLRATARRRRNEARKELVATGFRPCGHHEHVLEAGVRALDGRCDARLRQYL